MNTTRLRNARLIGGELCDFLFDTHMRRDERISVDEEIDLHGDVMVSSGWIDLHTHCFQKYELYGDDIDTIGVNSGVTCIVDAGTAGSDTIAELYRQIQQAKTTVFSFLNIAKTGICAQNELADVSKLDEEAIMETLRRYPDVVVGLKARMSRSVIQNSGNAPLVFARGVADRLRLPIMVHIGNEPAVLEDVFDYLHEGDIVTHIFNPKSNGILKEDGTIKPSVWDAHRKGIIFDVGHGTESFSFHTCETAWSSGLLSDTISTDIYSHNRKHGPVYSLAHTVSKLHEIGYSWEQCIHQITSIPARILKHEELGCMEPGTPADLTLFQIKQLLVAATDSVHEKRMMKEVLCPVAVVKNGVMMKVKGDGIYGTECL